MPPPDTATGTALPVTDAHPPAPTTPTASPEPEVVVPGRETEQQFDQEISGLDALELAGDGGRGPPRRFWSATWPKLAGGAILLGFWQVVVWSGWRWESLLPAPATVLKTFWDGI